MLNVGLLGLVQVDLEEARSIQTDSYSLPDNLRWVDQVVQDGVVYGHQSAGPRSLLLQLVGLPGGLGQDPPLGNEDDVLATELLLELSHQPGLDLLLQLVGEQARRSRGFSCLRRSP